MRPPPFCVVWWFGLCRHCGGRRVYPLPLDGGGLGWGWFPRCGVGAVREPPLRGLASFRRSRSAAADGNDDKGRREVSTFNLTTPPNELLKIVIPAKVGASVWPCRDSRRRGNDGLSRKLDCVCPGKAGSLLDNRAGSIYNSTAHIPAESSCHLRRSSRISPTVSVGFVCLTQLGLVNRKKLREGVKVWQIVTTLC